ncbi:MAG: trypsin-like peptidase domain-containing protein [Muribaculum sp.]|nr:trypsin-like peptidase domain-containing protein [Muribaculum sp.]
MYDNQNDYQNNANASMTGNFSGANSADIGGAGSANMGGMGAGSRNAQTEYFNNLESPAESKPQDVESVPVHEPQNVQSVPMHEPQNVQSVPMHESQNGQSAAVSGAQIAQSAAAGRTQAVNAAAVNMAQNAQGSASHAGQFTQSSAADNTTWVKAPVRSGNADGRKNAHEEKKMGLGQKIMLSISLGLFFGIFAGVGFYGVTQAAGAMQEKQPGYVTDNHVPSDEKDSADVPEKETEAPQIQQAGSSIVYTPASSNVSSIVKEVMPAMVSIINNYTEITSFWGQTYREELSASGSGIIVSATDEELLIVTNQHVVADAQELLVTLIDNTEVRAKIKGMDADMDLAVIAIDMADLDEKTLAEITVANLGDSDRLELGEQVIAIGNALGYGQSVTVGYISALDREIELEDGSVRSFIQTDAAINPGNSGGALLNAAGEVIGINSNKIGGSSIEGMGYAIPITAASPIIADLMERQTRNKVADADLGYMGITPQDVTDQIVRMYGMPKGVYVVSVYEGSGAEAAGINKGDVIVKFDGAKITCYEDLQEAMQYYAVGDSVKVTVMRPSNGEYVEHEFTLTLGRRPSENPRY